MPQDFAGSDLVKFGDDDGPGFLAERRRPMRLFRVMDHHANGEDPDDRQNKPAQPRHRDSPVATVATMTEPG